MSKFASIARRLTGTSQLDEALDATGTLTRNARVFHGSGNPTLTQGQIQAERLGSKQARRGRATAGFYTTPDLDYAQSYAGMMKGTPSLYNIGLKRGSRVGPSGGDITRISPSQAAAYREQGFDAVRGRDFRGKDELAILNPAAVRSVGRQGAAKEAIVEGVGMLGVPGAAIATGAALGDFLYDAVTPHRRKDESVFLPKRSGLQRVLDTLRNRKVPTTDWRNPL